jgi:serine/threonine-protein kinase
MMKYSEYLKNEKVRLWGMRAGVLLGALFLILLFFNYVVMPIYVSGDEVKVPLLKGMNEAQAQKKLLELNLTPMIGAKRYDEKYPEGTVITQKPLPGALVKEQRRVYLFISGGESPVIAPDLKERSLRDAKYTLERLGLSLGDTIYAESEKPKGTIIDQSYHPGTELKRGARISITLSQGKNEGMIRVPDLLGKSLSEAERLLSSNSLKLGRINYQPSLSLLPNTIIEQYPSKDNLAVIGDSVDVFVTKIVDPKDKVSDEE